jgi:thioredoxin 1
MNSVRVGLICLCLSVTLLLQSVLAQPRIQALSHSRPIILEFSREICPMCAYMNKVLQQLQAKYGDEIGVRILHYDPDDRLFRKYHVVLVPTQVLVDASGKEVYRHTGVFTLYELEKQLKQLNWLKTP